MFDKKIINTNFSLYVNWKNYEATELCTWNDAAANILEITTVNVVYSGGYINLFNRNHIYIFF